MIAPAAPLLPSSAKAASISASVPAFRILADILPLDRTAASISTASNFALGDPGTTITPTLSIVGAGFAQQLELLRHQACDIEIHAGDICSRAAEARDQPLADRIDADDEDNWNAGRRGLGGDCRRWAAGKDNADAQRHQLGRQRGQAVVVAVCPTIFNGDVLPFGVARLGQALAKTVDLWRKARGRGASQEADHRRRFLLRSRRRQAKGPSQSSRRIGSVVSLREPITPSDQLNRGGCHVPHFRSWHF